MTATIGVLCDCSHKAQRGNIILSADELITYSSAGVPISSNGHGTKLYDLPCGFYVAIADDISRSHQVVSFLYHRMEELKIKPRDRNTTDAVKQALQDTGDYVRKWIRGEICADYGVSEDEFLHDKTLSERQNIRADLKEAIISTELIVPGFGFNASPVFYKSNCIDIQEEINLGIFCGGSGSIAALNWLNFRGQNCFVSTQRSYFHVREAMHFAELSPVVGKTACTLLLQPNEPMIVIGKDKDQRFLQEWTKTYYLPDSSPLDLPEKREQFACALGTKLKQSASQMLK